MATAANLRAQIEETLAKRVPAAFSLKIRQAPEFFATEIAEVDAALEGGIPRGSITEISGAASSGKTSLVLSAISEITRSGAACAWVDVRDALSPESAAAAGVVLERLLWLRTEPAIPERQTIASVENRPVLHRQAVHQGEASRHPRNETRGMDSAISRLFKGEGGLLRDKTIGTPGRSNRPLSEPRCAGPLPLVQRDEQVAYDRLPARRGEYFLKELPAKKQAESQARNSTISKPNSPTPEKPWSRLEQALRATDLLLQAGGFAAIVLDMGDVLPQHTLHIPLATWYRFRLAAEQARTALILLTQSPCASSCAALALRCEPASNERWSNGETPLFQGQRYTLIRERNRNEGSVNVRKKPSARAEWQAQSEWTRVR